MKRRNHYSEQLGELSFRAHPNLDLVKVEGEVFKNRDWTYRRTKEFFPILSREQFQNLTLDQKTQLAGRMYADLARQRREQRKQIEEKHPDFFGHNSGQAPRKITNPFDVEERQETDFTQAKKMTTDWVIERGANILNALHRLVSPGERRAVIERRAGIIAAMSVCSLDFVEAPYPIAAAEIAMTADDMPSVPLAPTFTHDDMIAARDADWDGQFAKYLNDINEG